MWVILPAVLAGVIPLIIVAESLGEVYRRRARYREILSSWKNANAEEQARILKHALEIQPRCGAAWFLQGVLLLRQHQPRLAARAFGMAHHADCSLESAALLTFACLKAGPDGTDIHAHTAATWIEMRRPAICAHPEERMILEALAALEPLPPRFTPLGRLAWLVGDSQTRLRLEQVAAGTIHDARLNPLLET